MQHFALFDSADYNQDLGLLRRAIDDWIRDESISIIHMAQSVFEARLVVTFVYELSSASHGPVPNRQVMTGVRAPADDWQESGMLPEAELPY